MDQFDCTLYVNREITDAIWGCEKVAFQNCITILNKVYYKHPFEVVVSHPEGSGQLMNRSWSFF